MKNYLKIKGDRFIPNRSFMDIDLSHFQLNNEILKNNESDNNLNSTKNEKYKKKLIKTIFEEKLNYNHFPFKKILPFQQKKSIPYQNNDFLILNKIKRNIPSLPEKILDAPNFLNDFYLNLMDWNYDNILAIALGSKVYLWNGYNGKVTELLNLNHYYNNENNIITSVSWKKYEKYLSIGISDGTIQLWDAYIKKPIRILTGHNLRVGVLCWNQYILTSGSEDSYIHNHDIRISNHLVNSLSGHSQEVCGLQWSEDGLQLASGANDNLVHIWDMNRIKYTFDKHKSATKALSWCPWEKDLLATGGGTEDKKIRFWNTQTGICINEIDTHSQVSSLLWSKNTSYHELVSAHGFPKNQLIIWKYPSLKKIKALKGHEQRIISLSLSPDNKIVVSASADETLRFWKIFDSEKFYYYKDNEKNKIFLNSLATIR